MEASSRQSATRSARCFQRQPMRSWQPQQHSIRLPEKYGKASTSLFEYAWPFMPAARYRMLETIREYALDRLHETEEAGGVQARYMDFFLKLSQHAESQLSGPAQGEWLERLDIELENLRAAFAWNVQEAGLVLGQLKLALALSRFWLVRGHWEE